jgi:HAD superfamily hydrolase (TIGR01509 family)
MQAIIFDCFGVLTTDHWKEFISTLPQSQMRQARTLMYEHDAGRLTEAELIRQVKDITQKTPQGIEKLVSDENIKNTELLDYIKGLKPKYKIGLLSNIGSNWIRDDFLSQKEQALFDDMVLSHEVGMAKPDPGIFELAASRLGADITDCVLIDDSQGHCQAARSLGARAIIYDNFAQMKQQLEAYLKSS